MKRSILGVSATELDPVTNFVDDPRVGCCKFSKFFPGVEYSTFIIQGTSSSFSNEQEEEERSSGGQTVSELTLLDKASANVAMSVQLPHHLTTGVGSLSGKLFRASHHVWPRHQHQLSFLQAKIRVSNLGRFESKNTNQTHKGL